MFKLFKKTASNETIVSEPKADLRGKTTNEVIEEIHETFYTEVDRLLASALVANSLDTDKNDLIEKCNRLKALGFSSTQEVKEAEKEIARLDNLKRENKAKKTLIEAINYFSFKYPNYKFITEESVKKICAKYSLVYGEISRYTGTVPNKNLAQMEEFKVVEDDECHLHHEFYHDFRIGRFGETKHYQTATQSIREKELRSERLGYMSMTHERRVIDMKCPLEIAAPLKDFNMDGMEVKDFKISKIEIPDPIVLKPVIFNNQKHYLIVTAWGIEAADETVVNQKMN